MDKFDPVEAIRLIDRHRVTHSQWVPTMFVRMLKLTSAERDALDGSTHRVAVHAAAPCPTEVKRQMIEWWGPIIHEYYAGSEMNGFVYCDSHEWMAHPGTVGRAILGTIRICDADGNEVGPGTTGTVYFERDAMPFEYHNDSEKTRAAQHPIHRNWTTLGDIGHVDDDGYLFLTDRSSFMIISGGVNIYPREIEDTLVAHAAVRDVAVFGLPDPEMGEQVKAVVELMDGFAPSDALAAELIGFARERLAHFKAPKSLDFIDALPRMPTGKLYKHALRAQYLARCA